MLARAFAALLVLLAPVLLVLDVAPRASSSATSDAAACDDALRRSGLTGGLIALARRRVVNRKSASPCQHAAAARGACTSAIHGLLARREKSAGARARDRSGSGTVRAQLVGCGTAIPL
jgi:hypothetical protein